MMKKRYILFGLVVGALLGNANVQAASWHNGAPTKIRGSWNTKVAAESAKNRASMGSNYSQVRYTLMRWTIYKNGVNCSMLYLNAKGKVITSLYDTTNQTAFGDVKYKLLKKNVYYFKGERVDETMISPFKLTYYSKNHIKVDNIDAYKSK